MTTKPMTCDQFADVLADFLERDVDESTRAAVESHALGCEDCGALLADLRTLRIDAANLPELAPSRDLWEGIAKRIEAPVVELPGSGQREAGGVRGSVRRVRRWFPISAAAAALVAITAGTTYYMTTQRSVDTTVHVASNASSKPAPVPGSVSSVSPTPPRQDSSTAPASSSTPSRVSAPAGPSARLVSTRAAKPSAEEVYGAEIARLKKVVAMRRSGLDTATINVIEKNLAVIDSAIAQCRAALAKDPASRYLIQSLNSSLETKVELLRTAAQLPSHT